MATNNEMDVREQLKLIESMIAEGRRKTESWGWSFLLWGIAYYVAIAWASWGGSPSVWGASVNRALAWPITMVAACILTIAIGVRKSKGQPDTTMGRAVVSIWICIGVSMLLLFPALSMAGRLDQHAFVAVVGAMLGIANGTSGLILKWRMQFACAIVWWLTSVAACFGSDAQLEALFLAALFFCQIVFGIYAMILDSRRSRLDGAVHA
ncbi:MAG TPA: hypothetical protein VGG26_04435 [Terracidiphilus sp.]